MMNEKPSDQAARDRFAFELEQNFFVIAPAGSGKTRAVTDRIVALAKSAHALEWLPQLVVVTYTNRAANEMQQRARQEILNARVDVRAVTAFNRAFFGTIHSFCVKLLSAHGHHLGLPPQMELVDDDEELWNDFVQRQQTIGHSLPEQARRDLFRHIEIRKLMELGRRGRIGEIEPFDDAPCPKPNFDKVLAYHTTRKGSVETVARTQAAVREFKTLRESGAEFAPLPTCESKLLTEIWRETFGDFRQWVNRAALIVAAEVGNAYREFRLTRNVFTYDDQVALAARLFQHPEAARRIREQNYHVILDEAQDTAPLQFSVLLETTRPVKARGSWPNESSDPPRPGDFCMVGDFQQSIFGHHADLQHYQHVQEALIAAGGEALKFSVTFRLDQKNIDLINENFRELLNGADDQVDFVELSPRPGFLPGQILRVDLARPSDLPADAPDRRKAAFEAREVARWLGTAGLQNLRAEKWSEVAVLCPRKAWFQPLRDALRHEGFEVQIQSEDEWKGDNAAYAWLTALLTIMAEPHCTYETVGVLRDIFGISDHDLALYSEGKSYRFDLRQNFAGDDVVSAKLKQLARMRHTLLALPLFTAVQEVSKTTQLRERLHLLPPADFPNLDLELDRLLALAANAETEGATLSDFARHLRSDFSAQREPPATTDNAIQLITAHKAKGSEWQAVIVPFLARDVTFGNENFPRLLPASIAGETLIVLGRDDLTPEIEEEMERVQRQEMERLLYVALTRAKHTLILVSDLELFARKSGRPPTHSQMKWLRCESGGCNEKNFLRLSAQAATCKKTEASHAAGAQTGETQSAALPNWDSRLQTKMEKRANDFVRRINPSGFEELSPLKDEAAVGERETFLYRAGQLDNAATRYGHWWHQLLQRLPWSDEQKWDEIIRSALENSPERKRAEKEWKLFRAHLAAKEDFRKHFAVDRFVARSEVPFLLKIKPALALEGIIDLTLIDAPAKRVLILDWKTNRISRSELDGLRERYRPQLAAYWKAMMQITGFKVEAGLYSTALGEAAFYKAEELEREWQRLEELPPDRAIEEASIP